MFRSQSVVLKELFCQDLDQAPYRFPILGREVCAEGQGCLQIEEISYHDGKCRHNIGMELYLFEARFDIVSMNSYFLFRVSYT